MDSLDMRRVTPIGVIKGPRWVHFMPPGVAVIAGPTLCGEDTQDHDGDTVMGWTNKRITCPDCINIVEACQRVSPSEMRRTEDHV